MEFINTGLDNRILKSMDAEHPNDELIKAMNKQGLVQKEVQVRGKNGQIFTRKQWVKASDTSDNSGSSKPLSYEGKTDSEMRALFDGKTAADVQDEKARIFESLGRPGNGNPKRKEFERATAPLGRLIGDTINNGTGDASKDYDTLLKTSVVKASATDKKSLMSKKTTDSTSQAQSSSNSSKFDGDTIINALSDVNQGVTKRFATPGSTNIKNIAMNISGKKAFMKIVSDNNGVVKHDDKDNGTGGNFVVNGHKVDFLLKGKKLVLSFDESQSGKSNKPSLSDIQGYGYDSATATGDPTLLKIGDESYYKIKENKWQYSPNQGSALGGTYTDAQMNEKVSKATKEVKVYPSSKKNSTSQSSSQSKDKDLSHMSESELKDRMKQVTKRISELSNEMNNNGKSKGQLNSVATDSQKKEYDRLIDENGNLMVELGKRKKNAQSSSVSQKKLSPTEAKSKTKEVTKNVTDKKSFMEKVKAQGITWKENDHEGINWMRFCMSLNEYFKNGGHDLSI